MDERRKVMMEHMRKVRHMSLRAIGAEWDISGERVRQIIGNTGSHSWMDEARLHTQEIRCAIFEDGYTVEDMAKKYHVSVGSLRVLVGSRWKYLFDQGLRQCYRCHVVKPLTEFGTNHHNTCGVSGTCRECNRANAKHYSQSETNTDGDSAQSLSEAA